MSSIQKKITFSMEEKSIEQLKQLAAEQDRSVSAQVARMLRNVLVGGDPMA